MDILKYISLKDIIYFIIIIALAYRVYLLEQNHPQIEGMSTDEAISNIASVYNKGKLVVNELEVKGNTTFSGNTTIGGNATVNGSTTLKKNTTISGSATISGNATANGSTTLNKGCHIKGKHSADQTTLTIYDPGNRIHSHFYYKGNDTYISGANNVFARSPQYPKGTCTKTILGKGKQIKAGFINVPLPCVSTYKW